MTTSIIKPLFKNNENQHIINYPPIKLLPQISKTFEKYI